MFVTGVQILLNWQSVTSVLSVSSLTNFPLSTYKTTKVPMCVHTWTNVSSAEQQTSWVLLCAFTEKLSSFPLSSSSLKSHWKKLTLPRCPLGIWQNVENSVDLRGYYIQYPFTLYCTKWAGHFVNTISIQVDFKTLFANYFNNWWVGSALSYT